MIIDTHAHIGTLPPFDMTIEQVLYSMDKYSIDFTILSNIEGAENDHQQNPVPPPYSKPQNQLLRETINAVRPYTDRLGIMPWLRIQHELPDEEFVSLLKENRDIIYGLKLHPFHSLTAPDEERLEPIYRLAAEFDLPIASHTGGCEQAMSPHLYNAAKHHPEVKFIMVHMDLGTDNKTALQELLQAEGLSAGDIQYVDAGQSGPDHDKVFTVKLIVAGRQAAEGEGKSKKQAQQNAARAALSRRQHAI